MEGVCVLDEENLKMFETASTGFSTRSISTYKRVQTTANAAKIEGAKTSVARNWDSFIQRHKKKTIKAYKGYFA